MKNTRPSRDPSPTPQKNTRPTGELNSLFHEINQFRHRLVQCKDWEVADTNPALELAEYEAAMPKSLTKSQARTELASKFTRTKEILADLRKVWGDNKHLDILATHYTHYQSWADVCADPSPPTFDMRIPALRFMAEAYDVWARASGKGVSLKPYFGYFDGPGYNTSTLEAEITEPIRTEDARREIEAAIRDRSLQVPLDFITDTKAFITERARQINSSMQHRWLQVYNKIEQHHIEEMRKEMVEEHGLDRFKPETVAKLHSLTWENGHSSGFSEVKSQYRDLVELLETTLD